MSSQEVILITGASAGIGFETAKTLLQSTAKTYHIFLGSRSAIKGGEAISELLKYSAESTSTVEVLLVDVTDDDSITRAAQVVQHKFGKLDALVNNAGAFFDTTFVEDLSSFRSIFNRSFDVNVTGAQVMTATFAPLLIKSPNPRLIFLTSGGATLDGHYHSFIIRGPSRPTAGWPKNELVVAQGYKASKTAVNMLMLTWHWMLKDDGVKTWSISPGFLATTLTGSAETMKAKVAGDPALGGRLLRAVLEGERDTDTGKVVMQNGEVQPW